MFSLSVKWLALRAGQRQGGVFRLPPPYLWTPLSPQRVKGCSPLTIPKRKSKPKNASRFAKRIFSVLLLFTAPPKMFTLLLGVTVQQRGNTSCEAASRRNEKKAFSAAASFFPFRPLLWGLIRGEQPLSRGSSASKSLVLFWFSFGTQKRTLAFMKKRFNPRHQRAIQPKENQALLQQSFAPRTGARSRL